MYLPICLEIHCFIKLKSPSSDVPNRFPSDYNYHKDLPNFFQTSLSRRYSAYRLASVRSEFDPYIAVFFLPSSVKMPSPMVEYGIFPVSKLINFFNPKTFLPTLASPLSEVFETVLSPRLRPFPENESLLNGSQCGFRLCRPTNDLLTVSLHS